MYKVLHVVGNVEYGGAQTFIMNVFRVINKHAFSFDFYVSKDFKGGYSDEIISLGGKVIQKKISNNRVKILRIIEDYRNDRIFFRNNKNKYNAIHVHTNSAVSFLILLAAKKEGINKRIIHSHSTNTKSRLTHFIFRPFLRFVATDMLACGEEAGRFMFGKLYNEKYVINNSIDIHKYKFSEVVRRELREEYGINSSFTIGHIGRFNKVKNHKFLLDVFYEIKKVYADALLVLVGSGEEKNFICEYISQKGLDNSVLFLGNRNDVNRVLSLFDIVIFPSLHEGIPITLIEAQASGLPIIASDAVSKECAVNDNIIFLSLNDNAKKWAEEAIKILNSVNNEDRISNSRKISDSKYNINYLMEKIYSIYT